ncbi:MAG: SdrD B-like domain-containing protein [Dermatophilaceae bacterium]
MFKGSPSAIGTGTTVTNAVAALTLVDAVVYDSGEADNAVLLSLLTPGQPQVNENTNSAGATNSNQRCLDGNPPYLYTSAFVQAPPTPGQANFCASLTGLVWIDDGDGIRETGEVGLPNVIVNAYRVYTPVLMSVNKVNGAMAAMASQFVVSTTTDANGVYVISNLVNGDYYLEFVLPSGYFFTPEYAGDPALDSNANTSTGQTAVFALALGVNTVNMDAGATTAPTAIQLAGLGANLISGVKCGNASGADCVHVWWQTLTEHDTAGFVVVRVDEAGVVSQSDFIQSGGAGEYAWLDVNTHPGKTYSYWLQEIGADGTRAQYGPVVISVDGSVAGSP